MTPSPLEAALELAPQVRERWDHAALECEGECVHGSLTTRAEVWAEFGPLLAAVEYAEQEIGRLRVAIKREANVALDAIWHPSVASCGGLHDQDEPTSASSALGRLLAHPEEPR